MTRILLVRHGQTDHNREEMLQGQKDVELNSLGVEQAEKLSERLSAEDIDAVYSSDLARARATAEIVAEPHGLEPELMEELRERSYGEMEGEPRRARRELIDDADELDELKPQGGENVEDIRERVIPVIERIREEHGDGTVVVVSHGWTNRTIILSLLGAESGNAHRIRQGNTCINEFEYEAYRGWRINRINDTTHIDEN